MRFTISSFYAACVCAALSGAFVLFKFANAQPPQGSTTPYIPVIDPMQVMLQSGGLGIGAFLIYWMTREFSGNMKDLKNAVDRLVEKMENLNK